MNDVTTIRKIIIFGGGGISLLLVLYNLFFAFRLESIVIELLKTVIIAGIFLLPAYALWRKKETSIMLTKIGILYPLLVLLGFINIIFSTNQAEAALPMILIAVPFCIIYGAVVLVRKG